MVYSAYYDVRMTNKPNIRVFGVTRSVNPEKVLCRLYYDYSQKNVESKNDNNNIYLMNDKASFRDVHGKILVRLDEAEMMRAKAGMAFVTKYQQSYLFSFSSSISGVSVVEVSSALFSQLSQNMLQSGQITVPENI